MFTGIITAKGKVKKILPENGGLSVLISNPKWKVKVGDSIAVDGVCSTVKKAGKDFLFQYMPETLEKTNVKTWLPEQELNLEQSLRAGDRLDGHMVQGHVDTTGKLLSMAEEGNAKVLKVKVKGAKNFVKFLAPKGSVCLQGISLTVVDVGSDFFTVKIIPYTWEKTSLREKKIGDILNIEFDVLAKYLDRLVNKNK